LYGGLITLLITLGLFLFSEQIVYVILGEEFKQSIILIKILSVTLFLSFISTVIGVQILMPLNLNSLLIRSLFFPILAHLVISPFVIIKYQSVGLSVLIVITTASILIYRIVSLKFYERNKIKDW
jgi:O-antigen/teichoic acid export membrane protein